MARAKESPYHDGKVELRDLSETDVIMLERVHKEVDEVEVSHGSKGVATIVGRKHYVLWAVFRFFQEKSKFAKVRGSSEDDSALWARFEEIRAAVNERGSFQ